MTQLLVSVRSAAEAAAALEGGAHLIDVKEPANGPLGRASDDTMAEVIRVVGGRRPVSAALGEVRRESRPPSVSGLAYLKWGLADCGGVDWKALLAAAERDAVRAAPGVRVVTAAYADWQLAGAPPIDDVVAFALEHPGGVLLLDTYHKRGPEPGAPPPTLLDCLPMQKISLYCRLCRRAGVRIALAGSLRVEQIVRLLPFGPDWIAVRGTACRGGRRDAAIDEGQVRQLVDLLSRPVSPPTSAG